MATLVGIQRDLHSLLGALIELDYDAIEAYNAAISRLSHAGHRQRFVAFRADHERHVRELGDVLRRLGGEPPHGGDIKQVLAKGKIVLGDLVGGDRAILAAMRQNEEDCNKAYERVVTRPDVPGDIALMAERNLADERTHRAYIDQRLARMDEESLLSATPSGESDAAAQRYL